MAIKHAYNVAETQLATGGTGNLVTSDTPATGVHRTLSAGLADGEQYRYSILDLIGNGYEFGVGTWTDATNTFARNTIEVSSNSNNPINAPQSSILTIIGASPAKLEELETLSADYAPLSHVGAGGAEHAAATTTVAGFLSGADKTKLDGVDTGANNYSHPNHIGDVTSVGDGAQTIAPNAVTEAKIANGSVSNAKLTDMAQNKIKLRQSPGAGDPEDAAVSDLQAGGTPSASDLLLGQKVGGDLVAFQAGDLGGGSGTLTTVRKNSGADVSTGRARLNFIEGANVTLSIADDGPGDEVDITITSTAAGGGGGDMLSPVAAVAVGELYAAGDTAGVQTTGTSILASDVSGHIASTANPHAVTHAQVSPVADEHVAHSGVVLTAGDGLTGGGDITASRSFAASYAGSGGDFGSAATLARSDHAHAALYEPVGALRNVVEDATPQLGGNLETKGQYVVATRADDSAHGAFGALVTSPGAVLTYTDGINPIDVANGGVQVGPAYSLLYGTNVRVDALQHSTPAGRQVYVNESGDLYAVDPPPPGWIADTDDDGDYNLGTGDTPGPTTQITGLSVNPAQAIQIGDRVDVTIRLYVHLGKSGDPTDLFDKASSIEVGIGVNNVFGGAWVEKASLGPYFAGFVSLSFFFQASGAIGTGDTIDVFARRGTGDDSACNPWVYGTGNPGVLDHYVAVSVPGAGGGGGGDVLQGTGGADGELGVWNNYAGKTLGGASIPAADVARRSTANTFALGQTFSSNITVSGSINANGQVNFIVGGEMDSDAGVEAFARTITGATFTPDARAGQSVQHDGVGGPTLTISAGGTEGVTLVAVPAAITSINFSGYTVHGTQTSGKDHVVMLWQHDTTHRAVVAAAN